MKFSFIFKRRFQAQAVVEPQDAPGGRSRKLQTGNFEANHFTILPAVSRRRPSMIICACVNAPVPGQEFSSLRGL